MNREIRKVTNTGNNKLIHLELLRIIAILFVIFDHAGPNGGEMYLVTSSQITYVLALISHVLCKTGVPIFFMISGAVLLAKDESILMTYKKRIPRILLVLVVFSIIRYVYLCTFMWETFNVLDFLRRFADGTLFHPYWYLYTYVALLLVVPFLRRMVMTMDDSEVPIFMVVLIGLDIVFPVINALTGINNNYIPYSFVVYATYMIVGYLIENRYENILDSTSYRLVFIIFSVICIIVHCVVTGLDKSYVMSPTQGLQLGITIGIFYIVKWASENASDNERVSSIPHPKAHSMLEVLIINAGSCTFGIYLIEDYIRNATLLLYNWLAEIVTSYPASIVWVIVVAICSWGIVNMLRIIPRVRNIL